ncbi:hypothetical protein BIV57_20670 [Mangrovactinospora gilvigrisea]|uniref:Uncharacterized protein n=1 Tax=Mangrovactinospora gilvigrisea TaxID=1428644 RepID=A0A1J7BQ93_9ACTN|nr:DUF5304 family protein [Mangrovactinospora gilvigrisea]OIV35617.1 hypothetical protein BIV57_20670 [Mangrovactinospora gilvigrisea]
MSYGDDQDVWAQVCADDSAAADAGRASSRPVRGSGERATGSTTDQQAEDAGDGGELLRKDEGPEGRSGQGQGLTGIPEVDQIADEARKLFGTLTDKAKDLRRYQEQRQPTPIEEAVRLLLPLRSKNPDVFDHLTRAGVELVRAYQAAVRNQERRWANERARRQRSERIDLDNDAD